MKGCCLNLKQSKWFSMFFYCGTQAMRDADSFVTILIANKNKYWHKLKPTIAIYYCFSVLILKLVFHFFKFLLTF